MKVAEKHHPDSIRPPGWMATVLDLALLGAVCTSIFWKLVLTNQYTWLESPDLAHQVLPWYQFMAREWNTGRFPLWDPYLWSGQPMIGQVVTGAAYPLNWILFLLPLHEGRLQIHFLNWYFVAIHWIGASFCYLLLRDLRLSRLAALFGGALFGVGGYVGRTDWPQMLNGAVWTPLVALFLFRVIRGHRPAASAVFCGVALGASWLSGHHQIPIFLTLMTAALWIAHSWEAAPHAYVGFRLRGKIVLLGGVALLFAFCTGALQILPGYEYGRLAVRWVGLDDPVGWNDRIPYVVHTAYSFKGLSLLGIVVPGWGYHAEGFIGSIALSLAVGAVLTGWRERHVKLLTAVGIGGVFFALGGSNLLHGALYSLIPLVEKARAPGMAILLFHFAAACLAAQFLDLLKARPLAALLGRLPLVLALAAGLVFGAFFVRALVLGPDRVGDDRMLIVALCAVLASGVLASRQRDAISPSAAGVLLFLLMLVEVGQVTTAHFPHRSETARNRLLPALQEHEELAAFLRTQRLARVDIDGTGIPANFGDWHAIETYSGYLASVTRNHYLLERNEPHMKRLLNVKYVVRKEAPMPQYQFLYQTRDGYRVYLNPGAFPRAWTVHWAIQVQPQDMQDSARKLDLRQTAFLSSTPPKLEDCSGDNVRLLRHTAARVTLRADMQCRGLVLLADTYFPGWVARVDGAPTPIHEVDGVLRGVVVGRGSHFVEMVYRPVSALFGAALTALALLTSAILALFEARQPLKIVQARTEAATFV